MFKSICIVFISLLICLITFASNLTCERCGCEMTRVDTEIGELYICKIVLRILL